jgi:hypothetical protein
MIALKHDPIQQSLGKLVLAGLVLIEVAWFAIAGAFLWEAAGDSIFGVKSDATTGQRFGSALPVWLAAAWLVFGIYATWIGSWSGLWQSIARLVALTSIPAVNLIGILLVASGDGPSVALALYMLATVVLFVWCLPAIRQTR